MCKFLGKVAKTTLQLTIVLIGHQMLIRKRKRVQTKARARYEAQQQLSEFLTIAGHEMKTPLTSIKGNIQLMGRRIKNSADRARISQNELLSMLTEVQELLGHADQQITRLTRLVNALLDNARISNNMIELFLEECELSGLLHEVLENRQPFPSTRTIHLDYSEEKAVLILADISRVKQVITHYLSNAHKFSPSGQPIEVLLCEQEQSAYVSVKDYGQGIPTQEQEHIWDRFYRVPETRVLNGSEVGLGLGLYICRTFIERHHGQVGVLSEPGQGSTFWFTLPLLSPDLAAALH